jgi:hypothetical protein
MKKLIMAFIMSSSILFAGGFYNSGTTKGIDVEIKSDKTLIEGNNDIEIKLSKDGKVIKNAKVRTKFFMPEMPGMPYMEYIAKTKLDGDVYKGNVNFSMGGTWQYHVQFKLKGKKYKYRSSVNLGQSSSKGGAMKCGAGKCGTGKCGGGK